MWNKLFKSKSKNSGNKSKISNVVKSFSLRKNTKDIDTNDPVIKPTNLDIPELPIENEDLETCPICRRRFIPDTFVKHVRICEKAVKKRKPFDSFRQRREGTDLADFLPKHFGLPQQKQMPESKSSVTLPKTTPQDLPLRRLSEPTKLLQILKNEPIAKTIKRSLGPISEQCPYCERNFGIKAFDRHVEWCREKSRISHQNTTASVNAAKERLQARTKYKAPSLKSKREKNREKYSGLSCGESTNSLSDGGSPEQYSKSNSEERERKLSVSMTSSIASDGGLSDKYDPFLSAKRQLEELFPPSYVTTSTPKPNKTNLMTTSLNLKSTSNPSTTSMISSKPNFRRTSSLRIPKKTHKPLLYVPTFKSPTIQKGLSDEGPISSNFIKPEEFDELPVKCHAIIKSDQIPKITPREPTREPTREPVREPPQYVVKRDQNTNVNRRNLRLDIKQPNAPSSEFPLSKTDSLAIFLKYEDDLSCTPGLTEKEKKDKSNSLNKRTSVKNVFSDLIDSKMDQRKSSESPEPFFTPRKYNSIKLAPIEQSKNSSFNINSLLSTPHSELDSTYIDPKLINNCDNLSISVAMRSDSDSTSRSADSVVLKPLERIDSNKLKSQRNSGEKRSLKRQLKLNKENFLYDVCPTKDTVYNEPYSDPPNKNYIPINESTDKKSHTIDNIDSLFDDFDFDEFISSFEDDEQYPIFKNYKELMINRSKNTRQLSESTSSSESTSANRNEPKKRNKDNPIPVNDLKYESNETKEQHNEQDQPISPIHVFPTIDLRKSEHDDDLKVDADTQVTHREHEHENLHKDKNLLINIKEMEHASEATGYPVDSDELSSGESYPFRQNLGSKFSADSAYGSLSRNSPLERPQRRNISRQRQHSYTIPDIVNTKQKLHGSLKLDQPKARCSPNSLSSSGSDSSLPPISSHKMELHAHHKDSQLQQQQNQSKDMRLSKFCHDCGNRFTVNLAKFCMECGARRIVLE